LLIPQVKLTEKEALFFCKNWQKSFVVQKDFCFSTGYWEFVSTPSLGYCKRNFFNWVLEICGHPQFKTILIPLIFWRSLKQTTLCLGSAQKTVHWSV
jgi:hypothetical protein